MNLIFHKLRFYDECFGWYALTFEIYFVPQRFEITLTK